MKKHEIDLLIGTSLAFVGVLLLYWVRINIIFGWIVILIGKLIIFISAMEYVDYRRAIRGEDLTKDNKVKKYIRKKVLRKRY